MEPGKPPRDVERHGNAGFWEKFRREVKESWEWERDPFGKMGWGIGAKVILFLIIGALVYLAFYLGILKPE